MKKIYESRNISEALQISFPKWKRWGREFLGLDPVAGQSGGIARQFTLEQAFHIYLGGWLVNQLNFSIPESRDIVNELKPWLKDSGLWPGYQAKQTGTAWDLVGPGSYKVDIFRTIDGGFAFWAFGKIRKWQVEHEGFTVSQMLFIEEPILVGAGVPPYQEHIKRTLDISEVKFRFDYLLKKKAA